MIVYFEFIAIKGIKAMGNQFVKEKIEFINITIPEVEEEEEDEELMVKSNFEIPKEGTQGELF